MDFHYWFMFPISILVAITAMASGIGGATFFAPIFILGLRLSPEIAIGVGLLTEIFGFGSGLLAYIRKKLIDYRLGMTLLITTIPLAVLGSWLSNKIDPKILKVILGMGLFSISLTFLKNPDQAEIVGTDTSILMEMKQAKPQTCIIPAQGEAICYTACNRKTGMLISGLGGLFVGLISTGLGELNGYFLMRRCRVPSKVSVATSVFVVAFTALAGAVSHLIQFVQSGPATLSVVGSIVVFTIPGVIIGAQIGSRISSAIPEKLLERSIGVLFFLIAVITLGEVIV